jgi:hypothetical protein
MGRTIQLFALIALTTAGCLQVQPQPPVPPTTMSSWGPLGGFTMTSGSNCAGYANTNGPDSKICLINAPGFVGRLKMTPQSLFQFGTVSLHPTPDRRVIRLQIALGEQLFDIAERQRVPEIPAHGSFTVFSAYQPPPRLPRQSCNTSSLLRGGVPRSLKTYSTMRPSRSPCSRQRASIS